MLSYNAKWNGRASGCVPSLFRLLARRSLSRSQIRSMGRFSEEAS